MNILIVHNYYRVRGGEESVVEMQCRLFKERGHSVSTYFRHYSEIKEQRAGRVRSLFSSLYSRGSAVDVERLVDKGNIEVAIIHNLYPLISPSVLNILRRKGVRIVWVAHNYRLLCPIATLFHRGEICEKCSGGIREFHCFTKRCEGSLLGSLAYAMRGYYGRVSGLIRDNVDCYVALSEFQAELFERSGIEREKIKVIGNSTTFPSVEEYSERNGSVLFVGRITEEKGIGTLFDAARLMPDVPFVIAGEGDLSPEWGGIPSNVRLLGKVDKSTLVELYRSCSVTVIPSIWYETFSLISIEASLSLSPVIYRRIGQFTSRVDDGVTGLLFSTVEELVEKIRLLLDNKELAKQIAINGQKYSQEHFNQSLYVSRFEEIFKD